MRSMVHMSPAELAIHAFGGVRALARFVDRDPAAVSRWRRTGLIPSGLLAQIYKATQAEGLDITAEELILGADLEEEPETACSI